MKIIIFAGGSGRRLWPISLKNSPKQFEPIIGTSSTLRLAVDRVLHDYGAENIFVSTNERYISIVRQQIPELPAGNLIAEPARRDLAAAVGLALAHVARSVGAPDEPVTILWGDNYMSEVATFLRVLRAAEKLLCERRANILFIGETPRFANNNLGWIGMNGQAGDVDGVPYYGFHDWHYRPPLAQCQAMFDSGRYAWNTGYFMTTLAYVRSVYARHQPELWRRLQQIEAAIGTADYQKVLADIYPTLPAMSFDDAILTHVQPDEALVLHGSMGWSDPGTLYALKEAINPAPEANVEKGLVKSFESSDCLLYNYEEGKLLAAVGLEGMVVVNTPEAILVVHKDQIPLVKALVNSLDGTELARFT